MNITRDTIELLAFIGFLLLAWVVLLAFVILGWV
jgi:hypothetical protein